MDTDTPPQIPSSDTSNTLTEEQLNAMSPGEQIEYSLGVKHRKRIEELRQRIEYVRAREAELPPHPDVQPEKPEQTPPTAQ